MIDPEQADHPLARQHAELVRRESALGDELAAWTGRAGVRFAGSFVTGVPQAFRTSARQSRVIRERKRLERTMIRLGVMVPAGPGRDGA